MFNIDDELGALAKESAAKSILSLSDHQTNFLLRDLSEVNEEDLWEELTYIRNTLGIAWIEAGRRLKVLQDKYANHAKGEFEKKYTEKGLGKTEVYVYLKRYEMFLERKTTYEALNHEEFFISFNEQEENIKNGNSVVSIGNNLNDDIQKIGNASQKTINQLYKAPIEVKQKFYEGEISTANEIQKAIKEHEIIEAEIVIEEKVLVNEIKRVKDEKQDERFNYLMIKKQNHEETIKNCQNELVIIMKELEDLENRIIKKETL